MCAGRPKGRKMIYNKMVIILTLNGYNAKQTHYHDMLMIPGHIRVPLEILDC